MSKSLLCLSGWAQKFDSLEVIFKNKSLEKQYFINSFDYSIFDNIDELFIQLKQVKNCQIALGWSLGGQLLIRAIVNKIINPKLLILISPPFQMLKDSRISSGMTKDLYHKVKNSLESNSTDMLRNFLALISMNDSNSKEIIKNLAINQQNFSKLKFWYEELCRFSCFDLDLSNMPRILYFHGIGDMVVHISQKDYFQKYCPNFHSIIFEKCGHAPHISKTNEIYQAIEAEVKKLGL